MLLPFKVIDQRFDDVGICGGELLNRTIDISMANTHTHTFKQGNCEYEKKGRRIRERERERVTHFHDVS